MVTQQLDQAKTEAFAGQVIGMLTGALTSLMMSVGHRTGLFDKLATMSPATIPEIAKASGLNERYLREWLGNMTTSGIMEHDAALGTYWLPPEHAASITRAAGPGNLATLAEYVSLFGNVEDQIVDCFHNGGGVPYSSFPKFQQLMAQESSQIYDATLLDVTLPLVRGLKEQLADGIDAADVGCGKGHAINLMARAFPQSRFTGFDFSPEGIAAGKDEAIQMGNKNATFEQKDVSQLDSTKKFDFISAFDSIHDQAKPRDVLKGIYDSLKPGGTFLMADIAGHSTHAGNMDNPMAPMMYAVSTFHCMTVSLALGGEGLGTMWGEQLALELLAEAGFKDVTIERVEGDIMNAYYVCRKA